MSATIESAPPIGLAETAADLSRAEFLRRFGGLMLTPFVTGYAYEAASIINTVGTAIGYAEDKRWPHNEPSFTWLNPEIQSTSKQCVVYLPGFGEINPENNANAWLKASKLHNVAMGYMDYSNEGTDLNTMVETVRTGLREQGYLNQDGTPAEGFELHMVCRSIGGLYSLPFLAKLGLPVKSIAFISSPSRLEYGDFGNLGSALASLPKWRAVDTMAKTMVNAYRDYEQNGFGPLHNLSEGWRNTMYGANPTALHQELRVGKGINIQDSELLATLNRNGIIVPRYTEAAYSATYKPNTDITVHILPSQAEYEKVLRRLGIPLQILPAHYEGHAHVIETANRLRDFTQASMEQSKLTLATK